MVRGRGVPYESGPAVCHIVTGPCPPHSACRPPMVSTSVPSRPSVLVVSYADERLDLPRLGYGEMWSRRPPAARRRGCPSSPPPAQSCASPAGRPRPARVGRPALHMRHMWQPLPAGPAPGAPPAPHTGQAQPVPRAHRLRGPDLPRATPAPSPYVAAVREGLWFSCTDNMRRPAPVLPPVRASCGHFQPAAPARRVSAPRRSHRRPPTPRPAPTPAPCPVPGVRSISVTRRPAAARPRLAEQDFVGHGV